MSLMSDIAQGISGEDTAGWDAKIERFVTAVSGWLVESAGSGTYTLTLPVPAGADIVDVIVDGIALWTNTGAVSLIVGDGNSANGFYVSTNLKATDLLAGGQLSFVSQGGKGGAYITAVFPGARYSAAVRNVLAVVTAASTGGGAGVTRVTVLYLSPGTSVAAVKV